MSDDLAKRIVDAIVKDMTGRRGLRQEWEGIDAPIRREIVNTWRDIVRASWPIPPRCDCDPPEANVPPAMHIRGWP